jgi:hypothetical protein
VSDPDRQLLNSGLLGNGLDVEIDGLWFRLAAVDKQEDELTLTFEDREIAILRTYATWKIARREHTTRAEFILNLIREVREFSIPFIIPELHVIQPIERYSGDLNGLDPYANIPGGIPDSAATSAPIPNPALTPQERQTGNYQSPGSIITVKGVKIDQDQIKNANTIIRVGLGMTGSNPHQRKIVVCGIMTAIDESVLRNIRGGDRDSAGLFQQRPSQGWGTFDEVTNPEHASERFFEACIREDKRNPNLNYNDLCQAVQRSGTPLAYGKFRTEAERIVNGYGHIPNVNSANLMNDNTGSGPNGNNYVFYRGTIEDRGNQKIRKPENSWRCIQRLADDVDWRAFFIAGTFYFMSEEDLFKQRPIATITEFDEGIISMNGNYDRAKKSGSIVIQVATGKWTFPPGAVVVVRGMGPMNGRWIINDFRRNLFDDTAEVTLKKPRPKLPEPLDDSSDLNATWYDQPNPAPLDPTNIPAEKSRLIAAVLNNNNIQFSRDSQREDIQSGQIDIRVMTFLMYAATNGWGPFMITALKSDHSKLTSEGRVSAHGSGRAVDIGTFDISNPKTDAFMKWVASGQPITGFSQLIGPNEALVIPPGYYDRHTLDEHKNHCHIGWAIT